jgi:hypothetical protein
VHSTTRLSAFGVNRYRLWTGALRSPLCRHRRRLRRGKRMASNFPVFQRRL